MDSSFLAKQRIQGSFKEYNTRNSCLCKESLILKLIILNKTTDPISRLNHTIKSNIIRTFWTSLKNPPFAFFLFRTYWWQWKAARFRQNQRKKGLIAPPFLIFSVTNRCNLRCQGCYAHAQTHSISDEINADRLKTIIAEAKEIGISIVLFIGGEPLVRPEILEIIQDFPKILFVLLTNGLLINQPMVKKLKKQKNVIPFLSLEGRELETDQRRGSGTFKKLLNVMALMKHQKIFFGTSITITKQNFAVVTDEAYIKFLIKMECNVIGFVEFIPVDAAMTNLVLTEEQIRKKNNLIALFRKKFSHMFINLPNDEYKFGGCLSGGRGFVHVSSEGNVEPCPFTPLSDSNLKTITLREALQSDLLKTIRDNRSQLDDSKGGCTLWENREQVAALIKKKD